MIIRVATFEKKPAIRADEERMRAFRDWIKSQPGFRTAYHTHDSKTGRSLSISVWDDMASVLALKDRVPPGGSMGAPPDKVELYDEVEEF